MVSQIGKWNKRNRAVGIACVRAQHDFGQLCLVRIADDLGNSIQTRNLLRRTLRIAPSYHDFAAGIAPFYAANGHSGILFGGRGHRAGIQNYPIRLRRINCFFMSKLRELVLNRSTVRLRGAATEILYVKTCHGTILAYIQFERHGAIGLR